MLYVITPSGFNSFALLAHRPNAGDTIVIGRELLDARARQFVGQSRLSDALKELENDGVLRVVDLPPLTATGTRDLLKPVLDERLQRRFWKRGSVQQETAEYQRAANDIEYYERTVAALRAVADEDAARAATATAVIAFLSPAADGGPGHRYYHEAGVPTVTSLDFPKAARVQPQYGRLRGVDRLNFALGLLQLALFFGLLLAVIGAYQQLRALTREEVAGFLKWAGANVAWFVGAVLLIALGLAVYWVREHWRWLYGHVEFVVGLLIALDTWPGADHMYETAKWLAFFGGLYVMVRGLDNVGKYYEKTKTVPRMWHRLYVKGTPGNT